MSQADAPRLEAWIDTDGEGDELHVRVHTDGRTYESVDTDLATLLQTEQYLDSMTRSALVLLTLWERAVTDAEDATGESAEAPLKEDSVVDGPEA
jgi:hypothetical protein